MGAQNNQESFGNKALSTSYKISGWYLRIRMIGASIVALIGLIITIFGIYTLFTSSEFFNGGSIIILGLILLILGLGVTWFYWWRSKSLVQRRFY